MIDIKTRAARPDDADFLSWDIIASKTIYLSQW
jgi:hypothetical protein